MNVNIFLKQFKCSHREIISMIEAGDVNIIGPERLRGLQKILPETDEVLSFFNQLNPPSRYENFLRGCKSIPLLGDIEIANKMNKNTNRSNFYPHSHFTHNTFRTSSFIIFVNIVMPCKI